MFVNIVAFLSTFFGKFSSVSSSETRNKSRYVIARSLNYFRGFVADAVILGNIQRWIWKQWVSKWIWVALQDIPFLSSPCPVQWAGRGTVYHLFNWKHTQSHSNLKEADALSCMRQFFLKCPLAGYLHNLASHLLWLSRNTQLGGRTSLWKDTEIYISL